MDKEKILIVDDDKDIVNLISDILEDEKYEIDKAYNGTESINKVLDKNFNLIILDIMLPDIDGIEVCRKIRDKFFGPIIFLTAKNRNIDKIIGLEMGADDYITKPFDDGELCARVKAHLRRQKRIENPHLIENETIKYNYIEVNKNSFEAVVDGRKVDLSTREFQILCFLMENPKRVLTREQIYNGVWGYDEFGDISTVTVHIKKLREKINDCDRFIKTIWGAGYKFIGEKE
ncbi:response regulator transcription factor [Clostridium sp. OS1-26]|uniref:response regulator transcription factor n=1 Tax=Clostridium sp. OS1-26 TaxID=3070681 RepID=UPI0027E00CE9|nr:response regulator transcription factor [Clostridium sp. OS1-26]WML33093.1 response regulator transcription factor [Clostridium sp. OS1-26]